MIRTMLRNILIVTVLVGIVQGSAAAYAAQASDKSAAGTRPIKFDVVTIRLSDPKSKGMHGLVPFPDGFHAMNQSVRDLIMLADYPQSMPYWRRDRLVGAPLWTDDQYDIVFKVDQSDMAEWQKPGPHPVMLRAMLKTMLTERFKLVLHNTATDVPMYALVVGKDGPKLTVAKPDETLPPQIVRFSEGGGMAGFKKGEKPHMTFYGASMASLAAQLSMMAPFPVQDKTGLTGKYDFVLARLMSGSRPAGQAGASASDPSPIPWDVQGLGLKLEPVKGTAVTLVIDHIEKPSTN